MKLELGTIVISTEADTSWTGYIWEVVSYEDFVAYLATKSKEGPFLEDGLSYIRIIYNSIPTERVNYPPGRVLRTHTDQGEKMRLATREELIDFCPHLVKRIKPEGLLARLEK